MTHVTFVVSRNHLDLLAEIEGECRRANVEVIVDRRRADRRAKSEASSFPDRRHSERRTRLIARELDLFGIAVVVTS